MSRVLVLFVFLYTSLASAQDPITSSHVAQQAEALRLRLVALREAQDLTDLVHNAPKQLYKQPIHVWMQGNAILEKLVRYQHSLGLDAAVNEPLPNDRVTPRETFALVQRLHLELDRIITALDIEVPTPNVLMISRTSTEVYNTLAEASLLLNSVLQPPQPRDIAAQVYRALAQLHTIAEALDWSFEPRDVILPEGVTITPTFSNIRVFMNRYRLVVLQQSYGVPPEHVPPFPARQSEPEDVLDSMNSLNAELTRLRLDLDIRLPPQDQAPLEGKHEAADVYRLLMQLEDRLKQALVLESLSIQFTY